jgi:hypothetical protein
MIFHRVQKTSKRYLSAGAALVLLAVIILPFLAFTAFGQAPGNSPPYVTRVEERWSFLIGLAEPNLYAPQASTQMATGPDDTMFCNFHLNCCDVPTYTTAGLKLQAWDCRSLLAQTENLTRGTMNQNNDLVTWTQYLRGDDSGVLHFGVKNGASVTWGSFPDFEITVPGGSTYLDNYSPDYSLQNSGVTFGANRVRSMVIIQSTKFYSDGSYQRDTTTRVVFAAPLGSTLGP